MHELIAAPLIHKLKGKRATFNLFQQTTPHHLELYVMSIDRSCAHVHLQFSTPSEYKGVCSDVQENINLPG